MKIHINYAHGRYLNSQQKCCASALEHGFDISIPYGLKDLDEEFVNRNRYTLSQARGAGYWVWKPYIILNHVKNMNTDDIFIFW